MGENISWNRIHCVLIQPEFYEYLQIRDKTPLLFNLMFKDLTITVFVLYGFNENNFPREFEKKVC